MNNKEPALAEGLLKVMFGVCTWLRAGGQRWYERRQLQRIDLYDLGMSRRADIEQETDKPWWVE